MNTDRKRRLVFAAFAILITVGVLAYLAFGGIGENLVYYWSPSELEAVGDKAIGASIRLGGLVAPGSVVRDEDGLTLRFDVTDGKGTVPVYANSVPPAMFREGIGVVVEGTMLSSGRFETHRLLVKHDNQYQPPGEGEELDMQEMMKSMQFELEKQAQEAQEKGDDV
jgi:cytochrome c-type biogenesis protein CcmE